jgi:hypothetical protein
VPVLAGGVFPTEPFATDHAADADSSSRVHSSGCLYSNSISGPVKQNAIYMIADAGYMAPRLRMLVLSIREPAPGPRICGPRKTDPACGQACPRAGGGRSSHRVSQQAGFRGLDRSAVLSMPRESGDCRAATLSGARERCWCRVCKVRYRFLTGAARLPCPPASIIIIMIG